MIQEIYNYLLTREKIISLSLDDLIKETKEKNSFEEMIKSIHDIMYRENIFLIEKEYYNKIADYLQEFRFSYLSNKEVNYLMNEIIKGLTVYNRISMEERENYINNWIVKEICDRNLNNSWIMDLILDNELMSSILYDSTYLRQLLDGNVNLDNPKQVLATFNVICNQFFEVFNEDKKALNLSIQVASTISSTTKDRKIKKIAKKYIENVTYRAENYQNSKTKKKQI